MVDLSCCSGSNVQRKYDAIACGQECCGFSMVEDGYNGMGGYVEDADLGLGCGIPSEHARIQPGETILDLGSGAGLDVFIASRETGPSGRVHGLDFTPAMVELARANARKQAVDNVEFHLGDIAAMPFGDRWVDLVISNCTLNLVPDKASAFAETYRVLKPGGRFVIADVVSVGTLTDACRQEAEAHAGCIEGAMDADGYLELIRRAGFVDATYVASRPLQLPHGMEGLFSKTVTGTRPA